MNVATVVGVASAVISVASAIFAAWQVKLARVQAVSARSQAASAERQAREAESQTALMSESLKAETTAREAAEANRRMTLIVEFLLSARNLYETLDRYSSGAKITLAAGLAGSVLRTDFSARERLNDELDAGRDAYTRAKDALASSR